MAITMVDGCILEAFAKGDINVLIQCVNMMGRMNSGLAKDIKAVYPDVFTQYVKFCKNAVPGDKQNVQVSRQTLDTQKGTIVNVFGQRLDLTEYKLQNPDVDIIVNPPRLMNYGYISNALALMAFDMEYSRNDRIGIPYKFACNLAGGDWEIVLELIEYYLDHWNVFIYKKPE